MTIPEQMVAFATEIENVVDRYQAEFDLPAMAAVGVLELMKARLIRDAMTGDDGDPIDEGP